MRSLLILVLLGASAPGCCCTWDGPWAAGGHPALSGPGSAAYRAAYTPAAGAP